MTEEDTIKNKYKFNSAEEQKLYDVKAKLDIAKEVTSLLTSAHYDDRNTLHSIHNLVMKKAASYFPPNILTDLEAKINANIDKPSTFNNLYQEIVRSNLDVIENCDTDKLLRDVMVYCYLVKKCLPTKLDFVTNMVYSYESSYSTRCMKTRGYKSKRLPNSTKSIIIEDPKNSITRIKYLQSIQQFRKAGAHIIYIEQKMANENGQFLEKLMRPHDFLQFFNVAVSSLMGIISTRQINLMASCDDDINSLLTKWILDIIIPQVSMPSVFVLEDKHHSSNSYTDIPTMYSNKNVMLNWLELHDIPHKSNMHSAELFELIKRSSRNFLKRHVLEENLIVLGHKVLRRPRRLQYLNYFNDVWEMGKDKPIFLKLKTFNEISLNKWRDIESKLIETETKTLLEDVAVKDIVDKVFILAKHERVPYSDIKNVDDNIDEFKIEDIVKM